MENADPNKPPLPRPDLPPPSPPSPPPPDLPPPPPPSMAPPVVKAETPPPATSVNIDQSPPKPASAADTDEHTLPPGSDAPFQTRAVACIIDAFVGAGVYLVLGRINGSIAMLVYLAYWLTRDALPFLEGQSIGKKLMKIRAVTSTGGSLSGNWQASIVRNIPMIIPIFPLVELYMLYTRQTQPGPLLRFGDEWAKTKVIVVDTPTGI